MLAILYKRFPNPKSPKKMRNWKVGQQQWRTESGRIWWEQYKNELNNWNVNNNQVATAVRFLENDRVRASTEDMKRKFLLKKGLNESEIREAFARVKPQQEISQHQTAVHSLQAGGQQPVLAVTQSSFSTRVRDLLNLLLLIGGASYGIRYLWKVGCSV